MEIEKAIKIIEDSRNMQCDYYDCIRERDSFAMAIKSLNKEVPMHILNNDESDNVWSFDCPVCKTHYTSYIAWKYCPMCWQKLEY